MSVSLGSGGLFLGGGEGLGISHGVSKLYIRVSFYDGGVSSGRLCGLGHDSGFLEDFWGVASTFGEGYSSL